MDRFYRTELLLGKTNLEKLKKSRILILGLGGVGGISAEILARIGIMQFCLVDFDDFDITNLNRQILSTSKNVGQKKVDVARDRLLAIDPNIDVEIFPKFVDAANIDKFLEKKVDFVIDAIDSVKQKVDIIEYLTKNRVKFVSSMGAGFRTDPFCVKVGNIFDTKNCRLSRYIRKNLKKRGINDELPCVYSDEQNVKINKNRNSEIGSLATITNIFGIILADYVIKSIITDTI